MFKEIVSKRSKLYAGFTGVAALALLTACGGDEPAEEEPVDPGVEQQDPTQEEPMQEDPMQSDPAEDPMQSDPAESPMESEPAEDMGDDGAEVEGAGEDSATSTLGFVGTPVSWAL